MITSEREASSSVVEGEIWECAAWADTTPWHFGEAYIPIFWNLVSDWQAVFFAEYSIPPILRPLQIDSGD